MSERPFSQIALPMIVAHRGASVEEAENTLVAFELALELGAQAVEFDVRMTADGHPVVIHDAEVDRTTDGIGLVRSLTLADLSRLRIRTADGSLVTVPTLREVLDALSGRCAIDIEIKNIPGEPDFDAERESAVEAAHATLDAVGFVGDVIVSSFNPRSIAASRDARPDIATGLLTGYDVDARAALRFAAEQGHRWVLPFVERVRAAGTSLPAAVHATGMLLGTWISDDPQEALDLLRAGVDAVATNDPRRIVAATQEVLGR